MSGEAREDPSVRPEDAPLDAEPAPVGREDVAGTLRSWRARVVTVLALLVLVPGLVVMAVPGGPESRLSHVREPERALALVVGRTMDLRDAVARAPAWRRTLYGVLGLQGTDDVEQARKWYEDLARHSFDPRVDVALAILDAETGPRAALGRRLGEWTQREAPLPAFAALLEAAYADGEPAGLDTMTRGFIDHWLDPGWFRDRLVLALATRAGEGTTIRRVEARLARRGDALLLRLATLSLASALAVLVGLAMLVAVLGRRRGDRAAFRAGTALLPPPWRGRDGAAVLLRGGALSVGAMLVLLLVIGTVDRDGGMPWVAMLEVPLGLAIAVPTLVLAWRRLFQPAALSPADALGLRVRPGGGRRILVAALVVVAVGAIADHGIAWVTDALGAVGHWTEWFDEAIVFGSPWEAVATALAAVVVAPVGEELLFRGVLFASLRRRLVWPLAALVSALAFAVLHGYTVQGFASVAASGFLWAWAYERTRSLWPNILAHALGNATACALLVLALRY